MRFHPSILIAVLVVGGVAFGLSDEFFNRLRLALIPKNFATVAPGVLYRSGQMKPEHFAALLDQHGIRTVIALNPGEGPNEPVDCRWHGIRYETFRMPGNGLGAPEDFHRILDILANPSNHPVLVHCNAGAYRTGVAVGLFRIVHQGWTFEDTVSEMRYRGFQNETETVEHLRAVLDSYRGKGRLLAGWREAESMSAAATQARIEAGIEESTE